MPMYFVILNMRVTLEGSISLSCTFFWVTKQTQSFPRMAMLVMPDCRTALKAYSVGWRGWRGRGVL